MIDYQYVSEIRWLLRNFHYDKLTPLDEQELIKALNKIFDICNDEKYFCG